MNILNLFKRSKQSPPEEKTEMERVEATRKEIFGERDLTDYLGQAAMLKQEAKSAIKEKEYDRAWKLFHEQKQQYLKHASRSEFTPSQTLALDASVSEDLANILRLEGKHNDAFVHILYWIKTSSHKTKSQEKKLVAYFNRAKIPALDLDEVNEFVSTANSTDYRSIQAWLSEQIKTPNQRVDPTVKTPVESGNEQGTAGHP
jgi:hypothetical protein